MIAAPTKSRAGAWIFICLDYSTLGDILMNRLVKTGVFSVAVLAFLVMGLAAAFAEELQPSIHIPKMRHDYGTVFEQETYEYTFIVQNRGKADLVIDDVKPG
jgi:hypothetical protein